MSAAMAAAWLIALAPAAAAGPSQKTDDAYESDQDAPVYFDVDALPDATVFLPPPPGWSSHRFVGDHAEYIWGRTQRDTARGRLAASNAVFTAKDLLKRFEVPFGMEITPGKTPAMHRVLTRGLMTVRRATHKPKDAYMRKRPYVYYGESSLLPDSEELLRDNGSYPSGHAFRGWCMALLMAELNPRVQNAVLKFGHEYGESRIIAGYHWRSDVEAGRLAAAAAYARLHASKEFLADMAAAREELARLAEKGAR
ncbi:MAG: phosphatase PAP2 family protein [Kiritimatiellae bacterium]|nr:phosphatase PAP2 family protein [Kiritimatiellia bacterium]